MKTLNSEGVGRNTMTDYEHFPVIARGSTPEIQNWLREDKG